MHKEYIFNLLDLEKFAYNFSKKIKTSNIILFKGDLGSGKTTLIRFLIKSIFFHNKKESPKIIPSPTFSILQSYNLKNFCINHFDFYRINNLKEITEIGFEENIEKNISLIEWPEIILPLIDKYKTITIELSILDDYNRKIIYY